MKTRSTYQLPEERQKKLKRAIVLEWTTIFFLLTITGVISLTMGASQAMKSAWIEDVLSLIPPIAFLISMSVRDKKPTQQYPYGYRRAPMLAFLVAAVAILSLGLFLLYDSSMALLQQHHPTFGHFYLLGTGWQIWSGWIMIAALLYSMIPPVILGRMKQPLAEELHEKTLHADAAMNKADWMTAGAAILGILGVGLGFWWADAVAAGFIALDVTKDGISNVKRAITDLMDQSPTDAISGDRLALAERVREAVQQLPDVRAADVRLREEGHVVSGELFVVLSEQDDVALRLEQIVAYATGLDWRIYDLVVMPVKRLDG